MAGAVTVEGAKQSLLFNHGAQSSHYCARRFLLDQLRVIHLAGGVIHDHYQVVPAMITKPLVLTAVDVQQHPGQRSPRPTLPMHAPFPALLHQTGSLQRQLHPRVTQLDPVFGHELFVKVAHIEIKI